MTMELVFGDQHLKRVVHEGIMRAQVSIDIATADFKAMLVPGARGGRAKSIVEVLRQCADRGVEIRILHAGVPSAPALRELRAELPGNVTIRRCPRMHAKAVIIDCQAMYLGSANLTGAGLGAKGRDRRNFEWGVWISQPEMIEQVLDQFNQVWDGSACRTCKRRDICPEPLEEPPT
jgi:phosphatidylserine/phosphatidylglycerophosphate/cardiolipin synthase-like enzyme